MNTVQPPFSAATTARGTRVSDSQKGSAASGPVRGMVVASVIVGLLLSARF